MALPATQFEAATQKHFDPKLTSQIVFSDPFFYKAYAKAKTRGGGRDYTWKPKYARADTQFYGRFGILNRKPTQRFTDASLDWWKSNTPAVVDGGDIRLNKSNREQLIDLLATELECMRDDTIYNVAGKIWTGEGGLEPVGIDQATGGAGAVETDPTTGTYAGIDRATYSWWRNGYLDAAGANISSGLMEEAKLGACYEQHHPDLWVTSKEGYRRLYAVADALQRIQKTDSTRKLADLGFESINFDGVDVVWSDNVVLGTTATKKTRFYGFNMKDIEFRFVAGQKMKRTKWHEPENQDALVCDMRNHAVIAFKTPRYHTVLFDVQSDA